LKQGENLGATHIGDSTFSLSRIRIKYTYRVQAIAKSEQLRETTESKLSSYQEGTVPLSFNLNFAADGREFEPPT